MKRLLVSTTLLIMLSPTLLCAGVKTNTGNFKDSPSFLCIEDKVTGFQYDKKLKTWNHLRLNTEKYIVRALTNDEWAIRKNNYLPNTPIPYAVFTFGVKEPAIGYCGFTTLNSRFLSCDTYAYVFKLDTESLRFIKAYTHGYTLTEEDKEYGNFSPNIGIGKCSEI